MKMIMFNLKICFIEPCRRCSPFRQCPRGPTDRRESYHGSNSPMDPHWSAPCGARCTRSTRTASSSLSVVWVLGLGIDDVVDITRFYSSSWRCPYCRGTTCSQIPRQYEWWCWAVQCRPSCSDRARPYAAPTGPGQSSIAANHTTGYESTCHLFVWRTARGRQHLLSSLLGF